MIPVVYSPYFPERGVEEIMYGTTRKYGDRRDKRNMKRKIGQEEI